MKTLADFKRRVKVGARLLWVSNSYCPNYNGTVREVTEARATLFVSKMKGCDRFMTYYPKAKDFRVVDADTVEWELRPGHEGTVQLRFVGDDVAGKPYKEPAVAEAEKAPAWEPKHTRGPWKVDGGRMQTSTDAWHALISVVRPEGEDVTDPLVAEVYGPTAPGSVLDRDANAQLIAAAPEMFEEALWVVRLFGTEDPKGLAELKEHIGRLRAVLTKAGA